jgi:hypothetical protein
MPPLQSEALKSDQWAFDFSGNCHFGFVTLTPPGREDKIPAVVQAKMALRQPI